AIAGAAIVSATTPGAAVSNKRLVARAPFTRELDCFFITSSPVLIILASGRLRRQPPSPRLTTSMQSLPETKFQCGQAAKSPRLRNLRFRSALWVTRKGSAIKNYLSAFSNLLFRPYKGGAGGVQHRRTTKAGRAGWRQR